MEVTPKPGLGMGEHSLTWARVTPQHALATKQTCTTTETGLAPLSFTSGNIADDGCGSTGD